MKKILVVLLALVMAFALGVTAMAAEEPTIVFSTEEAKIGESIRVSVSIQNNPGVWGLVIPFSYDSDVLQLDTETTEIVDEEEMTITRGENNFSGDVATGIAINYNLTKDFKKDGVVFTLYFKVKDNAKTGLAEITVGTPDAVNFESEQIDFAVVNGGVNVVCAHDGETEVKNATEASCQPGFTGDTYCKICNEKIADGEEIPATGSHVGGTATCTEKAKCDNCGNEYGELADHVGGTATCKTLAKCDNCGNEYGELDGNNHEAEPVLYDKVDATCAAPGYTGNQDYDFCCGIVVPGTVTPKNPANHTGETKVINDRLPDCKNPGYTGDTVCAGCGVELAKGTEIEATGAHGGGEANCQQGALCAGCGTEYTEPDKNVHILTEVKDAKEATCGAEGYTGDTYCKACGAKVADGEVIPATGKHTGGKATCSTLAECADCGQSYGKYDAENHEKEYEIITEPGCETAGERKVTCKCGEQFPNEPIEALGHEYGDWKVVTPATKKEEGLKERTCERCGAVDSKVIPKVKDVENSIIIDLNGKGQTGEESNPNTGAPVFGFAAVALCALALSKKH